MSEIVIHIADWSGNDRVITVPRDKAKEILLDTTIPANTRMDRLYELALHRTNTEDDQNARHDPRASEMENAEMYLTWPGVPANYTTNENWDEEHAEDLAALNSPGP